MILLSFSGALWHLPCTMVDVEAMAPKEIDLPRSEDSSTGLVEDNSSSCVLESEQPSVMRVVTNDAAFEVRFVVGCILIMQPQNTTETMMNTRMGRQILITQVVRSSNTMCNELSELMA
jgi:hypothetical protein